MDSISSRRLSWSKPLPGGSDGRCFIQLDLSIVVSSMQFDLLHSGQLPEILPGSLACLNVSLTSPYLYLGRERASESGKFQGLLLSCLFPKLRGFPCKVVFHLPLFHPMS